MPKTNLTKNNNEIKSRKRVSLLERILPTEGKIAIKNICRDSTVLVYEKRVRYLLSMT